MTRPLTPPARPRLVRSTLKISAARRRPWSPGCRIQERQLNPSRVPQRASAGSARFRLACGRLPLGVMLQRTRRIIARRASLRATTLAATAHLCPTRPGTTSRSSTTAGGEPGPTSLPTTVSLRPPGVRCSQRRPIGFSSSCIEAREGPRRSSDTPCSRSIACVPVSARGRLRSRRRRGRVEAVADAHGRRTRTEAAGRATGRGRCTRLRLPIPQCGRPREGSRTRSQRALYASGPPVKSARPPPAPEPQSGCRVGGP